MTGRDPQEKVERVIAAAVDEFARAGPAGARIDAIARSAGMNKRLLYHYVGDKDALFEAAVQFCRECLARTASTPEQVQPEVWRILCHAVASNSANFDSMAGGLNRPGEDRAVVEAQLAIAMFRSLLPSLADALAGDVPAGRSASSSRHVPAETSDAELKPRIKLKPEVRALD